VFGKLVVFRDTMNFKEHSYDGGCFLQFARSILGILGDNVGMSSPRMLIIAT
jgi:hypothetical protein